MPKLEVSCIEIRSKLSGNKKRVVSEIETCCDGSKSVLNRKLKRVVFEIRSALYQN